MPQDKLNQDDPLAFLGLRDREILDELAEMDLRSAVDELVWLIRSRAFGRLKDLGDDAARPLVSEDNLPEYIHVKNSHLRSRPEGGTPAEQGSLVPSLPKPK